MSAHCIPRTRIILYLYIMAKNTPPKEQPIEPTVTKTETAAPKLQAYIPAVQESGNVTLIAPDGNRITMTRWAAERFKRGGRNADYQIEA